MINIGTTNFYLGVPSLPPEEFESYSTQLFDEWESYVSEVLYLPDYHLALDVQEGSISAKSKLLVAAGALYGGIAGYGSFVSGLNIIYDQVQMASEYFGGRAYAPFSSSNEKPKIRKRGEALSKIKSLFVRVKNGSISVEEAMTLAEKILGENVYSEPDLMGALRKSLEDSPSQIHLPFETVSIIPIESENNDEKKPSPPRPRLHIIRPDQYRVEVWRESKKSKRNVRVRKL